MKRKILGFAAIILAITASAFTVPTSKAATGKLTTYYWFQINSDVAPGDPVPSAGETFLGTGTSAPSLGICDNTNVHQCVSGFNSTQVNSSNQLKGTTQQPAAAGDTRN